MSRWYRAYEGTVTDAKIGEAALVAGCSRSVAIAAWHCILESCCSAQRGGEFDTNPRRVAVILSEPPATIEALFAAFADQGARLPSQRRYEARARSLERGVRTPTDLYDQIMALGF